jgi:nitrite reductase/ring-hydroxylating ferredoxin subunit
MVWERRNEMQAGNGTFVRAARADDVRTQGVLVVHAAGQTIALFHHEDRFFAVDNRCPHMGFPLHKGSCRNGILTCHWHHARFDLASGGTFDPFADDVRAYPTRVQDGDIWIDLSPPKTAPLERYRARLADGLEHNIRLVIAKAVIGLDATGASVAVPLQVGAEFGTRYSRSGWGSGLTILTAMANILPVLRAEDRPRALYQGLTHVARETAGQAPAFVQEPLPTTEERPEVYKRWFRQFVEVRDRDGAERTLRTAIAVGLPMPTVADIVFSAATDHFYIDFGHSLDFANKAFEMLHLIGWEYAEQVLPSIVPRLTGARRSEELASWRHPIDLAKLLWAAFEELPALLERGQHATTCWEGRGELVETLLRDNPADSINALKASLADGATPEQLASAVVYAAARRIAHFHTANEFGDWDTVLHTFTYANAVHQAIRRKPSVELLRGVFDAAMSVYLDRFLNMPSAALPRSNGADPGSLDKLLDMLNQQQQVNEVGRFISDYLTSGGEDGALLAMLAHALLREDADFHTFQVVEAGFRQYQALRGTEEGRVVLVAVGRYLAAHCPTPRAMGQTYQIALRLHRGEELYAEME